MTATQDQIKLALSLAFSGFLLVLNGFKRLKRARNIEDTAQIPIASAPMGAVELEGFAWPLSQPDVSFFESLPTVYLHVEVREHVDKTSRLLWKYQSKKPFFLLDFTGLVLVYPENAQLEITTQTKNWYALTQPQRDLMRKVVHRENAEISLPGDGVMGKFLGKKVTVSESCLYWGSPTFVQGSLRDYEGSHAVPPDATLQKFRDLAKAFKSNPQFIHRYMSLAQNSGRAKVLKNRMVYVNTALKLANEYKNQNSQNSQQRKQPNAQNLSNPSQNSFSASRNKIYGILSSQENTVLFISDNFEAMVLEKLNRWKNMDIVLGLALIVGGVYFLLHGGFK